MFALGQCFRNKAIHGLGIMLVSMVLLGTSSVSAHQGKEIDELKEQIKALQERVEQLERQLEQPKPSSDHSVSTISISKTAQKEERPEEVAALPVILGDFPGSYKVPGSDISVKLGGYVKVDFIKDLDFTQVVTSLCRPIFL